MGDWLLTNEFTHRSEGTVVMELPGLYCFVVGIPIWLQHVCTTTSMLRMDNPRQSHLGHCYSGFSAHRNRSQTEYRGRLEFEGGVGGRTLLLPGILRSSSSLFRVYGGYFSTVRVHRCVRRVSCEIPVRTFGIFPADCAEVLKPSAILYQEVLHTVRDEVQKHVFGIAEISPISPGKHDIELYLWMRPNRDSGLTAMDRVLEAGILRIIPEVTSEMHVFSWCIEFYK